MEASIAILLIIGIVLIIINQQYSSKEDISTNIYRAEVSILREIQLNDSLREDILTVGELPIYWGDVNFPPDVRKNIQERKPEYLDCVASICEVNDVCYLDQYPEKDTYAQSVIITSNLETYDPKQLKIFCWVK